MFDLGWTELLVIGVVALIVVGPKDLPVLFRQVGRFVGKAKGMAREFSSAMNDAADESGMRDISKTLKSATNPLGTAMDGVKDAARDVSSSLRNTDPDSETGKLARERADKAKKIQASTARAAADRKKREAEEAGKAADAAEAALTTDDTAGAAKTADDAPAKPAKPAKPAAPAKPAKPAKTAAPAKPAKPAKSDTPATPKGDT